MLICYDFCADEGVKEIFSLIGNIFMIIRIAGPILIILFGSITFFKAVASNEQDGLKKATSTFVKRIIASVLIFFVMPLVKFVIGLTGESLDNACMTCFAHPNDKVLCNYETTSASTTSEPSLDNNGKNNIQVDFNDNSGGNNDSNDNSDNSTANSDNKPEKKTEEKISESGAR